MKKEKKKTTAVGATPLSPGDLKSTLKPQEKEKLEKKLTIFDQLKPKCDPEQYREIMSAHKRKCHDMNVILNVVVAVKFE